MRICLIAVCFFRANEARESIQSLLNTLGPSTQVDLVLLRLKSPRDKEMATALDTLQVPKNVSVSTKDYKNYLSDGLLSISVAKGIDFVCVTESDIRVNVQGTLEKLCTVLAEYPDVGIVSPEYATPDRFHLECFRKWVLPRYPYATNKDLMTTKAQGFQLLAFRAADWETYCQHLRRTHEDLSDCHAANYMKQHQNKCVVIHTRVFMVHTGWDVYRPNSSDPQYLVYKNHLRKTGNLWKPKKI